MGFFQDLKQDLSQAVNEMVPEDADRETLLPEQKLLLLKIFLDRQTEKNLQTLKQCWIMKQQL